MRGGKSEQLEHFSISESALLQVGLQNVSLPGGTGIARKKNIGKAQREQNAFQSGGGERIILQVRFLKEK